MAVIRERSKKQDLLTEQFLHDTDVESVLPLGLQHALLHYLDASPV